MQIHKPFKWHSVGTNVLVQKPEQNIDLDEATRMGELVPEGYLGTLSSPAVL